MATAFNVNLEDLIFTREGSSNNLIVTHKDGESSITTNGDTSVTINDFKENDEITTLDFNSASIKEKVTLNVLLSNGATYAALADYTEKISLTDGATGANISGLGENDTLVLNGDTQFSYNYKLGHENNKYTTLAIIGHNQSFWITDYFADTEDHSYGFNVIEINGESENLVDFSDKTLTITEVLQSVVADEYYSTQLPNRYIYKNVADEHHFGNINITENTNTSGSYNNIYIMGSDGDDILTDNRVNSARLFGGNGNDTFRFVLDPNQSKWASSGPDNHIWDPTAEDNILFAHKAWDNQLDKKNMIYVDFENLEFSRTAGGNDLIINVNYPEGWYTGVNATKITLDEFFSKYANNALDTINFEIPQFEFYALKNNQANTDLFYRLYVNDNDTTDIKTWDEIKNNSILNCKISIHHYRAFVKIEGEHYCIALVNDMNEIVKI